jgi:hypothetical protein
MRHPNQRVELSTAAIAEIGNTVPQRSNKRFTTSMGTMKRRSQAVAIKETLELATAKGLRVWKNDVCEWIVDYKTTDTFTSKVIGSDHDLVKFVKDYKQE